MRTLAEITDIIKAYKDFKEDAEVARFLNIKPKTFAASKSRNSIPYPELITFCNQENISINWLLAGVGPRSLQVPEGKIKVADSKLTELMEKLGYIFKEGSIDDRAKVRGMILEIYDEMKQAKQNEPRSTGNKRGA